jgi:hypothetical protein
VIHESFQSSNLRLPSEGTCLAMQQKREKKRICGCRANAHGQNPCMELDKFIKLTLSQIIKGVEDARAESQGVVAPKIGKAYEDQKILRSDATHGEHGVFLAEFDVALMASDNSETIGSAGARVYVATLDGKKKATQLSSVHRLKFSVPISYHASKFGPMST